MVSRWHRGPMSRQSVIKKSITQGYPDFETTLAAVVQAVEDGESARDALLRLFQIGESNQFAHRLFADKRVVDAMMKRALTYEFRCSKYYKKAKLAETGGHDASGAK